MDERPEDMIPDCFECECKYWEEHLTEKFLEAMLYWHENEVDQKTLDTAISGYFEIESLFKTSYLGAVPGRAKYQYEDMEHQIFYVRAVELMEGMNSLEWRGESKMRKKFLRKVKKLQKKEKDLPVLTGHHQEYARVYLRLCEEYCPQSRVTTFLRSRAG